MKLLTIKQPFTNLIALKYKTDESRFWDQIKHLNYRGDILITASQKPMAENEVKAVMTGQQFHKFRQIRDRLNYDIYGPCGIAMCVVNFYDYRPMNSIEDINTAFVKYQPGLQLLCFKDIRPVVSFKTIGRLGLTDCPQEYEQLIQFE